MRVAITGAVVFALLARAPSVRADDIGDMQAALDKVNRYTKETAKAGIPLAEKLFAALARRDGESSQGAINVIFMLVELRAHSGDAKANETAKRAVKLILASKIESYYEYTRHVQLLRDMSMFVEAEQLLQRALAIAEGPKGNQYLVPGLVGELADVAVALGDYDKALALRKRKVTLVDVPGSQELPRALNDLAAVQLARRELGDTEATLRRASSLAAPQERASPGNLDAWTAETLLWQVVGMRGAAEEAREHVEQASLIAEEGFNGAMLLGVLAKEAVDRGDLDEATSLSRRALQVSEPDSLLALNANLILASVALTRGEREEAEDSLRAALRIAPMTGVMTQLARIYLDLGDKARAESLILGAKNEFAAAIKRREYQTLDVVRVAGQAAEANGRTADAIKNYRDAFDVSETFLRSVRLGMQEDRLFAILDKLDLEHDQIWSLVARHPTEAGAVELGLAVALLRKGRALDERAAAARAASTSDPQFKKLVELRREYARIAVGGRPGRISRADLEKSINESERALRATGREPSELPATSAVVSSVRKRLRKDELLVEIVEYQPLPFSAASWKAQSPLHYLAFVLGAKRLDAVDLGPVGPIDAAVRELREQISSGRDRSPDDPDLVTAQKALFDLTLGKLALGDAASLTLSLDGALQLVPLEATRDAKSALIDRYAMRYVTSGRDLLAPAGKAGSAVRIVADPTFSTAPIRLGDVTLAAPEPLPYTRAEANDIAKLFAKAQLFAGDKATSDAVFAGTAPRILHVATHGVFLDDVDAPPASGSRGVELVSVDDPGPPPPPNPMLRSALLLAHAAVGEDVVTAYRLADANLAGTELVVLSACETGLGERKRNQGVFGLRRALVVAGAETVVTSLWRVSDNATRDLMVAFYKRLLAGQGRAAALRDAALAIRKERPHPYYWAGFVVVGSSAPLSR